MITRQFDVFLNKGASVAPLINVNQFDSGETWIFTVYQENGEIFIPAHATIIGAKPDGRAIINTAEIDNEGRVVVTETEQMTAVEGDAVYELSLENSTHGTANFIVRAEKKPTEGAILSDSDISYLQDCLDFIDGVKTRILSILPTNVGNDGQLLTKRGEQSQWETFEALPEGGTDGQVLTRTGGGTTADWQDIEAMPEGGIAGQVVTKTITGYGWSTKAGSVNGLYPDANGNVQADVELTKAEYDALPATKESDDVNYWITDDTPNPTLNTIQASGVAYNNSSSGLSAIDVQDAINENASDIATVKSDLSAFTNKIYKTAAGSDRNAVLHAWMSDMHTSLKLGDSATFTGTYQSTMYAGIIWKATNTVIFGILFAPNSAGGFYFRDSSADSSASSTDFQ